MEKEEFKNENTNEVPETESAKEPINNEPMVNRSDEGGVGPIIGSIIVILIIIIGGIYYWNSIVSKEIQKREDSSTEQNESLDEIRASLESDFSELDKELEQIEAEFEAESSI